MASVERLTPEEVQLLKPWARKLELLESGAFPANTEARRHFLQVCRGEIEPETPFERAYLKWRVSKPDLDRLEADLLALAAKSQRLDEQVQAARERRDAATRTGKNQKRAAKTARLDAARRERRRQKELARRLKS